MSTARTQAKTVTTAVEDFGDLDRVIEETISQADRINKIVEKFEHFDVEDEARKALITAIAITTLRKALDPLCDALLPLCGSKLGFKADKPSKKNPNDLYDWLTVRDCMIEALLNGARLTGNEFNVIAGNCYFTKEFFERRIREFPGIDNVRFRPGLPEVQGKRVLVTYCISYDLRGEHYEHLFAKSDKIDERIPVKVTSDYDTDDMWLGKAQRKASARVYATLSGKALWDGDAADSGNANGSAPRQPNRTLDDLADDRRPVTPEASPGELATHDQLDKINALFDELGWPDTRVDGTLQALEVDLVNATPEQAVKVIDYLEKAKATE